ncbi:hypothetical protein TNCV_4367461 [Trichonephila clavipes]|nr:hypothetical protein TNCV_4367461 [Trichonephila clavipes]
MMVRNSWAKCCGSESRCSRRSAIYRRPIYVNSIKAHCPPVGVMWSLREGCRGGHYERGAGVILVTTDRGSKLRSPSLTNSPCIASGCDISETLTHIRA